MATARRGRRGFNINLDIDSRTKDMSDTALMCRTLGHKWTLRSQSRQETLTLLKQGLVQFDRYCENGCGCTWRQLWSLRERMMIENERTYPKNGEYLMAKGNGRLLRVDAVVANVARMYADVL